MPDRWTDKKRLSLDNRPWSIPLYRVAREVWFVLTFFRFYSSWSTLYSWKFGQSSRRGKNPSSIFICDNNWVFKLSHQLIWPDFSVFKDFTWLVAPAAFIWITENKERTVLPPGLCFCVETNQSPGSRMDRFLWFALRSTNQQYLLAPPYIIWKVHPHRHVEAGLSSGGCSWGWWYGSGSGWDGVAAGAGTWTGAGGLAGAWL